MVGKGPKQTLSPVQRPKLNQGGVMLNQAQSNAPFSTSYPSPSSVAQSSPHLQVHRNMSSPHAFSPSSPNSTPTSTIHHQQQKSQLPLSLNVSQTMTNQPNNWSNLPPNNMNNPNMNNMRTSTSAIGINNSMVNNSPNANAVNVTSTITLKRMQEQNPILNAQLSQDSISYVQVQQHSQNQSQQASINQTLPPSSNSPSSLNLNSSGLSMRFNRNSPVLTATSNSQQQQQQQQQQSQLNNQTQPNQQQQQQYPSPNHYLNNVQNVPSPTPQIQQQLNRNMNTNPNQQRLQQQQQPMPNRGMSSGQTYYPVAENIVSSNPMNMQQQQQTGQQQQQVVYGNCIMNNVQSSNVASSEYVKQGLRAKCLNARSHQQMTNQQAPQQAQQNIQSRAQLMQQNQPVQQQQHLTSHTHIQSNSSTPANTIPHHLQMQQSTSNLSTSQNSSQISQPVLSQTYGQASSAQLSSQQQMNSNPQLSQNSPQQLNSSLTDEDLDAIGLALSVNNDSSFFSFNDLSETNTMVSCMIRPFFVC